MESQGLPAVSTSTPWWVALCSFAHIHLCREKVAYLYFENDIHKPTLAYGYHFPEN
ncbi:hypothetical protein HMI56_002040 [Coelomomyces lativittatus]|nr:hypothetical protein HMI56_002040 [Coelomomyces lativittatus]